MAQNTTQLTKSLEHLETRLFISIKKTNQYTQKSILIKQSFSKKEICGN